MGITIVFPEPCGDVILVTGFILITRSANNTEPAPALPTHSPFRGEWGAGGWVVSE